MRGDARGLSAGTVEAIRKVDGVVDVKTTESGLEIRVKQGVEARPAIARIVTQSGAELLTIGQGERMLEKAYIEALRSGAKAD